MSGANGTAANGTATGKCEPTIKAELFDLGCLAPAMAIILTLAFMNRRNQKWPGYCDGRPGLVIPVNFLRGSHNRFAIAFAFGTIASEALELLIDPEGALVWDGPPWSRVFTGIVIMIVYGIIYYPLLACLTTEHRMAGSLMGFLYSAIRFSVGLAMLLQCTSSTANTMLSKVFAYISLLIGLPPLLCLLFLVLKFAYLLFKEVRTKWFTPVTQEGRCAEDCEFLIERGEIIYVQNLLNRQKRSPRRKPWYIHLRNKIYQPNPAFKFSTQVLSTLLVVLIVLYEIALGGNFAVARAVNFVKQKGASVVVLDIIQESGYPAVNLAWIFMIIIMLAFMKKHRSNVMSMWQNGRYVFPGVYPAPAYFVGASLRYSGFQVAYAFFGYAAYAIVLFITFLIFAVCIKLASLAGEQIKEAAVELVIATIPVLGVWIFVWLARFILWKFVFRDRGFPDVTININNRRLYCVVSFFFFFLDILVGTVSCVFLLARGIVLGVVFLPRLDRSSLMQGFQNLDKGYMAYVGLVHVLVAHRHPVLLVFCWLLLDPTQGQDCMLRSINGYAPARRSRQASNRWFLAVTLMRNPQLIPYRRQHYEARPLYVERATTYGSAEELLVA